MNLTEDSNQIISKKSVLGKIANSKGKITYLTTSIQ
jgi:hypothetical protein